MDALITPAQVVDSHSGGMLSIGLCSLSSAYDVGRGASSTPTSIGSRRAIKRIDMSHRLIPMGDPEH